MAKALKVVVLGTRGFPNIQGGVEVHCEKLYPRLAALGCDVTVIGRVPYTGKMDYQYRNVQISPGPCLRNKFFEAFTHTFLGIFKVRKMKPDILHIHAIGPSLFVPLARFLGMRVVMTHHGPDYERKKWNGFAKAILKLGECMGVTFANQIITISHAIAEHIKNRYHREATVIPNGVEIPQRKGSEIALDKYGLRKQSYVLAVGRFVPEKGFHDLIDAFNLVPDSGWKLVIVGDADHEDHYSRGLKEKAKANPDIILTGFLTEQPLQELYSHAGFFVLSSYYEGLPIVLLEAMSCGLSCLVSDIPANREIEMEAKHYFNPGDIDTLARKIKEFMKTPFSEEWKREQVLNIAAHYDWTNIAERTKTVYEKVTRLEPQASATRGGMKST